jgi:hypothetical protein
MGWSWNLLMRLGAPSVKAMISVWTTLIRPHLEYGAEIWPGESNSSWKEAEALQRAMARRILCCRSNIPAEVLRGELGWPLLENRRSLLRMGLWEKILKAKKDSWLRRVYESSRQQCAANLLIYNWCSQTRIELFRLGLGKCHPSGVQLEGSCEEKNPPRGRGKLEKRPGRQAKINLLPKHERFALP